MKYKGVLFDVDGVLVKESMLFGEKLSVEYDIDSEKIKVFFMGPFALCSRGQADLKEELAKVIDDWGWRGTIEDLLHFWFTAGTVIDSEVVDAVRTCKKNGLRCFVATDNEKYRGEHLRKVFDEEKLFEEFFISGEMGVNKKEPEFFLRILRTLGLSPEEILYFDDSERNVAVAKSVGIAARFFTSIRDLHEVISE